LTTNALPDGYDLYVRDLQANTTRLVDADTNGVGAGVDSTAVPSMSSDGRFAAFESGDGNLFANDGNRCRDVFVRDLTAGATELISMHHPTLPSRTPRGPSGVALFSVNTNGRFVAFASEADDLVPGDTNGCRDVFVCDMLFGTNAFVSVDTNGVAPGDSVSTDPAISGDGRYVVFTSLADNLVAGDTNKVQDVFVRDMQTGLTELVSVSTNGVSPGNADSSSPAISLDGRFILFHSVAKNLAPGLSGVENLFLRDRQLGTTYALTTGGAGFTLVPGSMTQDGRFVAFAGIVGSASVRLYVWDSLLALRVYTNSSSQTPSSVSISPDGRRLAYVSVSTLSASDRVANTSWSIAVGAQMTPFVRPGLRFSGDGRFLAYGMRATNSIADANAMQDVYLYDFQTGTNLLVSRSVNRVGTPNGASDSPDLSADGRFVAYRASASDSIPGDLNGVPDVVLYDRLSDATILVSLGRNGNTTANNRTLKPMFSGDGSTLMFQSWASDLASGDFNQFSDLFALKLSAPVITDSDGDGMDDQWELDHFGTLNRDGTGDFDGDGASDLFEFQSGTNPNDPQSLFRVTLAPPATLTWPAASFKSYRVQYKDDLSETNWHDLNANVALSGSLGTALDLLPTSNKRFYRILLNP
jgi:Tol biopolymer transport system component